LSLAGISVQPITYSLYQLHSPKLVDVVNEYQRIFVAAGVLFIDSVHDVI